MASPLLCGDYQFLRDFLSTRIGHELGEGKEYLVQSRLGALTEANGIPGLAALFDRLRKTRDAGLESAVVQAMVTCETSFFRTPSVYDSLRSSILPELIRARDEERHLSIWCAGCSTGQEPFSVALTIADHFPELRRWDVSIVATDISEKALQQGRSGSYTQNEVRRGVPEGVLRSHFHASHERWVIDPEIRRMVTFRAQNLVDPLLSVREFDIILARNVLIYFCSEQKKRVLGGIRRAIRDDGYLFLGESETILGLSDEFTCPAGGQDFYRPI